MKNTCPSRKMFATLSTTLAAFSLLIVSAGQAPAANKIWNGRGQDGFWATGGNWVGGVAPIAGDSLTFTNVLRLANTNNFGAGTSFAGITFASPSGNFTLSGSSITLGGDLADNQVVTPEIISLPLTLSATRNVNVVSNASLVIGGGISGAGFGLTKFGGGNLTLNAANTYSGTTTINAGSVFVSSDSNLGAAPASTTPASLVINGGTLHTTTNNFTLNANRGIALGPTSGTGFGTISVDYPLTLTYGGVMANNGGTGGLIKLGFGGLTLAGTNTYTGATSNRIGTITLDFTQATSPPTNIINAASALTLGGANAGFGTTNFAQITMLGKAGVTNSQTFNGTHVFFGGSVVLATNGSGGQSVLNLGKLDHDPGGTFNVITPALGGGGNITTTTTNVNGILGGWATLGDGSQLLGILIGTNWAAVDANSNIVNYTGYRVYQTGDSLHNTVTAQTNLMVDKTSTGDVFVDTDNAGTTNDVNTISFRRFTATSDPGLTLNIGNGNTLRLGKFGSIFKQDTVSTITWVVASGSSGGANGVQDSGTLTAGGADNTPGEIVLNVNNTSSSSGNVSIDSLISDNGSGSVTFVKTGPGSMKLRGHNTYSGGCYLLQGRVQFVGGEVGTGNETAGGSGPIYILPGAYLFPSSTGPANPVTNSIFIGGNGTQGEPLGAMRLTGGWNFTGPMTLIGDTTLGGNGGGSGPISCPISGNFSLSLCSPATVNGTVSLANPNTNNSWTGTTTLLARNNTGNNTFLCGANDVIPHGFGKGNVVMSGFSVGTIVWNLNGFDQTINGLSTTPPPGVGASCFIENDNGNTNCTLTVGDNDQSGIFAGTIRDNNGSGGQLALTKIGGGVLTLAGTNNYTGDTVINGGALALSGVGSIPASGNIIANQGTTLDVSGLGAFFSAASSIVLSNADFFANRVLSSAPAVTMAGSALTLVADVGATNINTTTLSTGGTTNVIDLITVSGVSGYPATFTIVKYTGSIGGAGFNFGLGTVPTTNTVGAVNNDVANSRVVLVLTNGPKPLTWTGTNSVSPTNWDVSVTTNWLAFKGQPNEAPVAFNTGDSVLFDDTGTTKQINLTTNGVIIPGGVTVSNNASSYAFGGAGTLSGFGGLAKFGSSSLTVSNTGNNNFSGGVSVNAGTVILATDNSIGGGATVAGGATLQIGNNTGTGTPPPTGNIAFDGNLVLNRGANLNVLNTLTGAGTLTKSDTSVLTLSGINSFTGPVVVNAGTLRTAQGSALGTADSGTTINSGATLDVNGQNLGAETVTVSGTGIGNNGAIINTGGTDQANALQNVILAGNTTFGATNRWDIRSTNLPSPTAMLSTGGHSYDLLKVGPGQFSLGSVNIDSTAGQSLGNITISNGIFSVETNTSSIGDTAKTLRVDGGGTFQMATTPTTLDKLFVFNGNGVTNTFNNASGASAIMCEPGSSLNRTCLFNVGGQSLTINGTLGGSGNLIKLGGNSLFIASGSTVSYSGWTSLTNGTLIVDGLKIGGSNLTNWHNATLAGYGIIAEPVIIQTNGTLSPGDAVNGPAQATLTFSNSLTLTSCTNVFELSHSTNSGNDLVAITNNLTLKGTNILQIVPTDFPTPYMTKGDIYTLFTYGGTLLGGLTNFQILAPTGYVFHVINPATTPNVIQMQVDQSPGDDVWRGGDGIGPVTGLWDNGLSTNWVRFQDSTPVVFTNGDFATFDDSGLTNGVVVTTNIQVASMTFNNSSMSYTLKGSGSLNGGSGLTMTGSGSLTIINGGTNTFSGPISITGGSGSTLTVGDGSTHGNLGPGNVTNNDSIVIFNRSDSLTVSNRIFGNANGAITNIGTGILVLAGGGSHTNLVSVAAGTLQVFNNSALGSTNGVTVIQTGATLDFGTNTINIGLEPIYVSGSGVGGHGAIVNNTANAAFAQANLAIVNMETNVTFGGTGRLDLRSNPNTSTNAYLNTGGNAYNLSKVGTNLLQMAGVQVDPALADISLQAGSLGIETWTTLGNPTNTLTVFTNATLTFLNLSNVVGKILVLNDGASLGSTGGSNVFVGALTVQGSNTFNVTANSLTLASNALSGSTTVFVKRGSGLLKLFALPSSTTYDLAAGRLDILNAGGTLSLGSGQTVRGGGTLQGNLTVGAGAFLTPGETTSVGTLIVSNGTPTLSGTSATTMKIDKRSSTTNDALRCDASIALGGSLTVTNITNIGTNLGPSIKSGDVFTLFISDGLSGSITPASLPPLWPGLSWSTAGLNSSGAISVAGTPIPPQITASTIAGTNVSLSGTGGLAGATYVVLASANVALPLANWTPLASNAFGLGGTFSITVTNAASANFPQRFFTIQAP